MPVKLTVVKCPSCGQPIEGKTVDMVFICDCGVLHTRDDEGVHPMEYVIAAPKTPDATPSALLYIPFWVLTSDVRINYTRSSGGFFNKLFGKDWKGGRINIYVPAVDWDPETFKYWATALTSSPPRLYNATSFGPYPRLPVVLGKGQAAQLADFLILSFEAEKPGVLQEINYEVKVLSEALMYLPFNRARGAITPVF